jgi:hypothetical protein
MLLAPKNGRRFCRPDVIAGFKIWDGRWKDNRSTDLAERGEIVAVRCLSMENGRRLVSYVPLCEDRGKRERSRYI